MSKTWEWSKKATVAAFLPTNLNNHVTPDMARQFVSAAEEVQFEVLQVLDRRAQPFTSDVLALGALFLAFYTLVLSRFVQADPVVATALLTVVTAGLAAMVMVVTRLRSEQVMAIEWRTAFERALQHPPKRRWFSRVF